MVLPAIIDREPPCLSTQKRAFASSPFLGE